MLRLWPSSPAHATTVSSPSSSWSKGLNGTKKYYSPNLSLYSEMLCE